MDGPGADDEVDAVLLEQLGALAGFRGARGAQWSARRLQTETYADSQSYDPVQHHQVASMLGALLQAWPQTQPGRHGWITVVRGVVGAGFLNMNPTYVIAVLEPDVGRISVAAHAKEGLIKQHSAQKAVRRIFSQLSSTP